MSEIAPQQDCASRSKTEPDHTIQKDKPGSLFESLLVQQAQKDAHNEPDPQLLAAMELHAPQRLLPINDPVNHPEHYKSGGIETIDVLQAKLSPEEFQGYCLGNALKYLTRRHYKGKPEEDLKKAHWYLSRALGIENDPSSLYSGPLAVPIPVKDPTRGAPLITKYPAIEAWNCIQPGCLLPRVDNRLYCADHTYSKGKSRDKEVPDGQ